MTFSHIFFTAAFVCLWAVTNRLAGTEKQKHWLYIGPIAMCVFVAFAGTINQGLCALTATLSYFLWRTFGWYDSIDMGKDEGTMYRDYAVFSLITLLLALPPAWAGESAWWFVITFFGIPLTYFIVMRIKPNYPGFRHIAKAEYVSGGLIGLAYSVMLFN